ncbi:MAG: hypothetical protein ACI835_003927 [Planctomycetota bacterium]|jgi:hypothetical protein
MNEHRPIALTTCALVTALAAGFDLVTLVSGDYRLVLIVACAGSLWAIAMLGFRWNSRPKISRGLSVLLLIVNAWLLLNIGNQMASAFRL